MWGKGFLQGTQNKFLFLPESRTDFIFSVISEEVGFMGALVVLLYFYCYLHDYYALFSNLIVLFDSYLLLAY